MEEFESSQSETEEPKASDSAVEFLESIAAGDVDQCVFADSLVTVSESGRELGDFSVSVTRTNHNQEPCYLLHATSNGIVDDVPCGTTIKAYISTRLEILEESRHEYLKLQNQSLERKIVLRKEDGHLVVKRVRSGEEGEDKQKEGETSLYPLSVVKGLVSEGSNFLVLRIMAQQKSVPADMTFLSFDADNALSKSYYRELGWMKQMVGEVSVDLYGIERTVSSTKNPPETWHCYFLSDGHLASRVQLGSPAMMKLVHLPPLQDDVKDSNLTREKKPLIWEEDIELYSKFLDKKEELKEDKLSYMRQHPEIKLLMADFLQFLLLRKPEDVYSCAQDFFVPFVKVLKDN